MSYTLNKHISWKEVVKAFSELEVSNSKRTILFPVHIADGANDQFRYEWVLATERVPSIAGGAGNFWQSDETFSLPTEAPKGIRNLHSCIHQCLQKGILKREYHIPDDPYQPASSYDAATNVSEFSEYIKLFIERMYGFEGKVAKDGLEPVHITETKVVMTGQDTRQDTRQSNAPEEEISTEIVKYTEQAWMEASEEAYDKWKALTSACEEESDNRSGIISKIIGFFKAD